MSESAESTRSAESAEFAETVQKLKEALDDHSLKALNEIHRRFFRLQEEAGLSKKMVEVLFISLLGHIVEHSVAYISRIAIDSLTTEEAK